MNLNAVICQEMNASDLKEIVLFYNLKPHLATQLGNPFIQVLNLRAMDSIKEQVLKNEESLEFLRNDFLSKPNYKIIIQGSKGLLILGDEELESVDVISDIQESLESNALAFVCDRSSPLYIEEIESSFMEKLILEKLLNKIP